METVDWLHILPETGFTGQTSVYIDATDNEKAGSTRYATVRFTNGEGLYADLNLTQTSNTADMYIDLSPTYIYVQGGGGTFYVNITTNTFWRVSDYDTFLNITSNSEDGYGDATLTIVFPPNDNSNNWYGYDHNGRPFYGRDGEITVSSLAGTKKIIWEQAAYNAITVTPNSLIFPESGGSMTVTVSSSTDWNITSYDSATTSFSALSGHSGETVVLVTKVALTEDQKSYYMTKPSTAEFSDGHNVALLKIDSNINDYYIDDDYVTVTYYVPDSAVNTDMFLFRVATESRNTGQPTNLAFPSEVVFQDEYHTTPEIKGDPVYFVSYHTAPYFAKFTTPGYHMIKYKFPDNTLITKYMFAFSKDIVKVVVGNKCNGVIMACSLKDATNCTTISLGLGTIQSIGETAFSGCGSYSTDFILPNGVKEMLYYPFKDFKARRFIFDMNYWGVNSSGSPIIIDEYSGYSGTKGLVVYGMNYGAQYVTATTSHYSWSYWPGPFWCSELVFGQNVKAIYPYGIYPFGYTYVKESHQLTFSEPNLLPSEQNSPAKPIECSSIVMLKLTPPSTPAGIYTNMTRTTQNFTMKPQQIYTPTTVPVYFGFLPSTKPFHIPVLATGYGNWLSVFTNNYQDINI